MKNTILSKLSRPVFITPVLIAVMFGFSFGLSTNTIAQHKNTDDAVESSDSRAQIWAKETGEIAGGAAFCKLDPEIVESYITRAQARIASEAHSDVELVVARITFSNTLNTTSISEPEEGCEDFSDRFERESVRLD